MGWLTKIIKGSSSGSSHRVSEGRDQESYEHDEIWEEPPATVVGVTFFTCYLLLAIFYISVYGVYHFIYIKE